MTAELRLWSKSTKVSDGQRLVAQVLARDHLPGALQQQEQNTRRLFAQLNDDARAAQFSTVRAESVAPLPFTIAREC
jgi:hypothetical protein